MSVSKLIATSVLSLSALLCACHNPSVQDDQSVNPNLKKDEPEFFSKSGAQSCVGGALVTGLACLFVTDGDKLPACVAAAAAGCAVGITVNYYLDKVRADYSNLEDQLDATKEQIQKSIASTSSLKKSTEDLIRDDSVEADRIVKNIKDGKAKKSELDDKIKEMESNLAYMQKRLAQDKEIYNAHKGTQSALMEGKGAKPNSISLAKKKNSEITKELANADNELLELENAVIEYSQKTASYKKIQEALS
ncbi:MAG: hypothetical protein U0O25_03390 [Succinivibrio sp.]|uniref:hypothetical protein n=1 Tax=Succinivibrio sp. TaxID=2053619 RepID=UPI002F92B24C